MPGYGEEWPRDDDSPTLARRQPADPPALTADPCPAEGFTHLGFATRLAAAYGQELRYVAGWNRWLVWDGRRWEHDTTGYAARCVAAVARGLLRHAATLNNGDDRGRWVKAARNAEGTATVRGTLEQAATLRQIAVTVDSLDADPYLLNCDNGVLDLQTLTCQPHDPTLLMTKVAGASYRPRAPRPCFDGFLHRIQPEPDVRDYLARTFGLGLLGRVVEHVLTVLHGAGANGKSTLVEVILSVLGDYAMTADPGLLVDLGAVHPTGVADLFGKRLAVTHETDAGRRLAEGTVKRLTGGDRIKARRMREDFWQFDPSHSVVMVTNHRPLIGGTDEGIWRRVRLVPFDVVIPPEERDGGLKDLLGAEADGVLAWLVAGYADWHAGGMADPEAVRTATADYRADSDNLGRFLTERCLLSPMARVQSAELYSAWQRWCAVEHTDPGSNRAMTTALEGRGYDPPARTRRGAMWTSIGLLADEDGDPRE